LEKGHRLGELADLPSVWTIARHLCLLFVQPDNFLVILLAAEISEQQD
jgi:hypothetical protein